MFAIGQLLFYFWGFYPNIFGVLVGFLFFFFFHNWQDADLESVLSALFFSALSFGPK